MSAISQSYQNYQVIVSDNASSDNTKSVVESFDDERIIYINPGRRLSMSSHWEFALSHINKGMVTILGDDDGLLPNALNEVNRICNYSKLKAVRSTVGLYYWPGFFGDNSPPQLTALATKGFQIRNCKRMLQRVLDGYIGYGELPMLYTGGFIDISVVNQIRNARGELFGSVNPDIYSAISLAHCLDDYAYSQDPLAIGGYSRYSNGAAFFRIQQTSPSAKRRNEFIAENDRDIHEKLKITSLNDMPKSMQLLVCESYLQSSHLHDRKLVNFVFKEQVLRIAALLSPKVEQTQQWLAVIEAAYPGITAQSRLNRLRTKLKIAVGRVSMVLKQLSILHKKIFYQGNSVLPLGNVYEASIVSAHLLRSRPSFVRCFSSSFEKLIKSKAAFSR